MKYLLFILIIVLGSCDGSYNDGKEEMNIKQKTKVIPYSTGATVIVVNGCQYVLYQGYNSGDCAMVHCGNCNNPFHKK